MKRYVDFEMFSTLLSIEYLSLCFSFDRHHKGAHFYQRGATAVWVAVAPTDTPGSATGSRHASLEFLYCDSGSE